MCGERRISPKYLHLVSPLIVLEKAIANNTQFSVYGSTNVELNFSNDAFLNVEESGLPTGAPWEISIGNHTYSSTNSTISVQLNPSLSYGFTISTPENYYSNPSSGNINIAVGEDDVNGSPNSVLPVVFTPDALSGAVSPQISTFNLPDMSRNTGSQFNLTSDINVDTITSDGNNNMIYISYTNTSNTAVSYVSEVNSSTYSIEGTQILGTGGTPTFSVFDPLNGLMYYITIASGAYA